MTTIMTKELENKIITLYLEGMSGSEILKEIKLFKTTKTIYDILRKYDIKRRETEDYSYHKNSSFFERIDTWQKAYCLGLMITDGWVSTKKNVFGFSSTNQELTEFIVDCLEIDREKIQITKPSNNMILGKEVVRKEGYQIQAHDRRIKDSLINLGFCIPKTRNEMIPIIEPELYPDLIRGILDGDGCIYELSNKTQAGIIFYSGSKIFLRQISNIIYTFLGIDVPEIKEANTIYKVSYYRQDFVKNIGNWMWNGNFFLKRKYEIWAKFNENN